MVLVGEYIFIFPVPVCYKYFIIPSETNKTHICKILLANQHILSPLERCLIYLKTML